MVLLYHATGLCGRQGWDSIMEVLDSQSKSGCWTMKELQNILSLNFCSVNPLTIEILKKNFRIYKEPQGGCQSNICKGEDRFIKFYEKSSWTNNSSKPVLQLKVRLPMADLVSSALTGLGKGKLSLLPWCYNDVNRCKGLKIKIPTNVLTPKGRCMAVVILRYLLYLTNEDFFLFFSKVFHNNFLRLLFPPVGIYYMTLSYSGIFGTKGKIL